jgi:hypothetical protein
MTPDTCYSVYHREPRREATVSVRCEQSFKSPLSTPPTADLASNTTSPLQGSSYGTVVSLIATVQGFSSLALISSALKMEATRSSETSVHIKPARLNNPGDEIHRSHRPENLKAYNNSSLLFLASKLPKHRLIINCISSKVKEK